MEHRVAMSVITPVYNGEKFLDDYALSLYNQTFKDFEVVVIDDGSTDHSSSVLEKYSSVLNLKMVKQNNQGIPSAIRRGLNEASTNQIVLMDQDDMAVPTRLEQFAKAFDSGYELIMSAYELVNEDKAKLNKIIRFPSFVNESNILLESFKRNYFLGSAMGFIFKGDISINESAGGTTDYDIAIKMLLKGYRFRYLPDILLQYRCHSNNTSSNYKAIKNNAISVLEPYSTRKLLNQLVERGFRDFDVYLTLFVLSLFRSDMTAAERMLTILSSRTFEVEDDRLYYEFLFYKSVFEYRIHDIDGALMTLNKVYEEARLNASVINNMGVLIALSGNSEKARFFFKEALQINPEYLDASRNYRILESGTSGMFFYTERLLRDTLLHSTHIKGL